MRQKKLLSIMMAVVLSLCSLPITAVQAQETFPEEVLQKSEMEDFEKSVQEITPQSGNVKTTNNVWEGYRYEELEDGTLEITGYEGNNTELVIPAEIDGKRVTRIGDSTFFYDGSSLTRIELPEGVTSIGDNAFRGCSNLTRIGLPAGLSSIGSGTFYGCSSLTRIELPTGLSSIGGATFFGCSSLTRIELPAGLSNIGRYTFYSCRSLTGIELPEGVTSIGSDAFSYCSSVTRIELPEGVTSIESDAFSYCSSLTEIAVDGNNTTYMSQDGILYDKNQKKLIRCPGGKTGNIVIPATVTSIGDSAFSGCRSLTGIELPEGVTSIGSYAFSSCRSLTGIELPEGVISIGSYAFKDCSCLTRIELPEGVTSIGDGAFGYCRNLTGIVADKNNITYMSQDGILYDKNRKELICCPEGKTGNIVIPVSVTSIGGSAFYGCSSLTRIELSEGVTSIRDNAFKDCRSLTGIELPEGVTSIGSYAFYGCSSLTGVELPEGVTSIGSYAFSHCSSLTGVELPEGVTSIGYCAFYDCSSLIGIMVDENNTTYMSQDGILYDKNQENLICCPGGETGNIVIPASVTSIEPYAFYGCSSLTGVELPEGVTSIGSDAFSHCSGVTRIELPEGVTSIGSDAFEDCRSLTGIIVDEKNPEYMSQDGILYDKKQNRLICCPGGKTGNIIIPASVISTGGYTAFGGCSSLTGITVDGKNPEYMSQDGILYNKNQKKLICCPGGKTGNVVIPANMTSIESYAFEDCRNLTRIELPEGVTSIGDGAFRGCSSLTEIMADKNNPVYMSIDGILYNKNQKKLICCPEGKTGSIVISVSVTSVGYVAFKGCSSLTEIMVDENNPVYMSQNGILYNKNQKKLIRCPEGKTGKIVIPKSIIDIDEYAFDNCKDLVLLVCKGSYAEAYAKNYNLNYRYIDDIDNCSHTWDTNIVQATTKKNGSVTKTCTKCGKKTIETVYAVKNINLSKTSYTYNGKIHKPSVIVKNSKGKALKNKKDYTTTYSKNIKNVGSYIITIKLKGNYKDTVKKTFQIVPKGTKISKITPKKKGFVLKWNKQSVQTTGYEIAYSTNKKFTKKTTGTITIGKNKTVSKSVSKLKVRKKYFVKIRTYKTIKRNRKSKKLYSTWSKVKVVTTKK